jgi:TP901 family phage tail tape measure protein
VSDINSNIRIDFDTGSALAQLRSLQAGLSKFHQTLAEGNLAAANAQKGLTSSLIQSINATGKFVASQKTVSTSTAAFTTALEKNQLSLKEYFRYSAAAATANTKVLTRAFESEREILNRARRDRVKALQSQYIQLQKANGSLVKTLQVMPRSLQMANGQFTELGTRIQMAAQKQQFLNQLLKQGSTQLLNFGKNMQWAGRQLMVGLTIPLSMLAGYAAKAFRELEKETLNFRRVYGDMFTSDAETEKAIQNIQAIANEYTKFGVAVKDTVGMAAKAAAAGFTGGALEAQVRQANKLAVLGQIEQQQALETTISLQNAFGISSEELAKKIDFLNAVENQTVLSIEDLTIAIPKAAPVVKQLGGSVEDLAFFLTAMKEGGINASEGANALKSGLASLINPTKQTSAMLKEMGININGIVEGNAGDLKGTVLSFASALDTLAPLQRARAIEQMFGKFQFARLSTLFQNVASDGSQASRALKLAGASVEELAILSERELGKVEDAVGVKFQASIEKLKQSLMPIGKEFLKAATPIVEFFGKMFDKFNNLSDGTKKVVTIITAALGLIGPVALMTFGLLANGAANVIKFFALLRGGIAKLNGQTNVLGAGFDYLTQNEL